MPEIGPTLREARMRARIDVSEIEAQTKIRAKYLRALENEEWGLLPGPTFIKSFLRTYAQALGLDGRALVEEYRLNYEHPSEAAPEPIVASPRSRGRRPGRRPRSSGSGNGPSRGYMIALGGVLALIVVLVVLLAAGGGGSGSATTASTAKKAPTTASRTKHKPAAAHALAPVITLSLQPSAVVYVCLLGDNGRKLIPGSELQPGETTPTYHARRFQITLGNSSVTMIVDGRPRTVPPSSEAIGYTITKARGRQPLAAGSLPTCR
jgi:cytoskeleton protein RodZ